MGTWMGAKKRIIGGWRKSPEKCRLFKGIDNFGAIILKLFVTEQANQIDFCGFLRSYQKNILSWFGRQRCKNSFEDDGKWANGSSGLN